MLFYQLTESRVRNFVTACLLGTLGYSSMFAYAEAEPRSEGNKKSTNALILKADSSNKESTNSSAGSERTTAKHSSASQVGAMAVTADNIQQGIALGITETAEWIDSFFADPDYPREDVDVRLDVRQYFTWIESHPEEHKTRVKARVRLPSFSDRVSLTFDGNDETDSSPARESISDAIKESDDNPNLGLQYLNQVSEGYSERIKLGYRFSRRSAYIGGRIRKVWPLDDNSLFRVSQRLRWYQRDGWENQTIADYETMLTEDVFFQQRVKMLWQEYLLHDVGSVYELGSSIIHPFDERSAVRWSWLSQYQTQPQEDWTSSQFSVSYRQQFWRDWMYVELGPFVRWQNQNRWFHDYGFNITFQFIIEENEYKD